MLAKPARTALWLLFGILLATPLFAQQYVPKTITFSGDSHDKPASLLSITGLHPGVSVSAAQIRAGAQHLLNTGIFAHVQFTFNGVDLKYILTPSSSGQEPVSYLNFPWWNDTQLTQAITARLPLFHGKVAPESAMQQQVANTLTALVAVRGVHATITAVPSLTYAGQSASVSYEITSPLVVVGTVILNGVSTQFTQNMAAVQKAASGHPWNSSVQDQIQKALNAVYHRHGYLRDQVTSVNHGTPQLAGNKLLVPVTATVQEGSQYHFAGLTLDGTPLPASEKALRDSPLHPGDVADAELLRGLLMSIELPYRSQGYLDAKIRATPAYNRIQHIVSYTVSISPGPVYHFRKFTVTGLTPEKTAVVLKYWNLKPGDAFNATYPSSFLLLNKKTLPQLNGWSATYKEYDNTVTHTVDLTMKFAKGGQLQ